MSKTRANKTVAWLACVTALGILAAPPSFAEAMFSFSAADLTITLHDEFCQLKAEIKNLPRRAVWKQKDEEVEGCWGYSEKFGLILFYFADKTSTALPAPLFNKVTGV